MKRAATFALVVVFAACVQQTELLPPAAAGASYPFCPTTIDVYGGANVALVGCGGRPALPMPAEDGYFTPGESDYDSTLAGRLQARLAGDPQLTPRFGSAWTVRDCAAEAESLVTLAPPLPGDACGPGPAPQGPLPACLAHPAPLVVLVADASDDHCHGGGPGSIAPDDPDGYARHLAQRLGDFVDARLPQLLLVGPETAWRPADSSGSPAACAWQRLDWDRAGVAQWSAGRAGVTLEGDLQDTFEQHGPCCHALGVVCAPSWFVAGPKGATRVSCDGAQALVDFWYARLSAALLGNRFACP